MLETFLAQHPDDTSPIAFKAVSTEQEPLPFVNPVYARTITFMLEQTGCDDPQARLLARLSWDGSVTRRNAGVLKSTTHALGSAEISDPAEVLTQAVSQCEENGSIDRDSSDALSDAIYGINFEHVRMLDKDGLLGVEASEDGQVVPAVESNFASMFGEDSAEQRLASSLGLSHFGYQHELVWTENEFGLLQPTFLSNRQHIALGSLGLNGQFNSAVTVLDTSHPVRQVESNG